MLVASLQRAEASAGPPTVATEGAALEFKETYKKSPPHAGLY